MLFLVLWVELNGFLFHETDFNTDTHERFAALAPVPNHIEFFMMVISFFVLLVSYKTYNILANDDRQLFKWFLWFCLSFFVFSLVAIAEYLFRDGSIYDFIGDVLSYIFYMVWILLGLIFCCAILKNYIIIKRSSLMTLCVLIVCSLSLLIYIGISVTWGRPITQLPGFGHAILVIFITVLYDFVIVCLINTKNRSVQIILIGVMIFIAASLWVMCAFIQNSHNSEIVLSVHSSSLLFNMWVFGDLYGVFGLLVMLLGCSLLYYSKHVTVADWFRETDSIISRLVTLVFGISMMTFVLFFSFIYAFSIIDKSFFPASPFFIIVYSIIVIIHSVFIGQYFEAPFKKIAGNIDMLLDEHNSAVMDESFSISEFVFLQRFIKSSFDTVKEKIRIEKQLVDLASQVAHDIRSPLTALDMILLDLSELDEEKRVIVRNANSRIRDIANNLLSRKNPVRTLGQAMVPCLLLDLIEQVVSEKRVNLSDHAGIVLDFQYDRDAYDVFVRVHASEFGSLLSNLLNNAIEALPSGGAVIITLLRNETQVIMMIQDNGVGMPASILEQLGTPGVSYGKDNGHGLGVSHAVSRITAWQGRIDFVSRVGEGTQVTLQLPLCAAPSWFLKELVIPNDTDILILDDDASIHHVWNRRFESLNLAIKNCVWYDFYSETELVPWLKNNDSNRAKIILCDYEIIGSDRSGLDVIETLGLAQHAILVTSRYQHKSIVMRCEVLGIKLLPKSLAIFVPVVSA